MLRKSKKVYIFFIVTVLVVFFDGCSSVKIKTRMDNRDESVSYVNHNKSNVFRYKPVIGTEQDDTKVMIDMGKFAKIWIKNYRNKNRTFIASHDIITMIKEPGFIAGEDIPANRDYTIERSYGANTFTFRSQDLVFNSSDSARNIKNKDIKQYINNFSEEDRSKELLSGKKVKLNKYDQAIKEYIRLHKAKNPVVLRKAKNEMTPNKRTELNLSEKDKEIARLKEEREKLANEVEELREMESLK